MTDEDSSVVPDTKPGRPRKLTEEEWARYMQVRYASLTKSPYLVHAIMSIDVMAVDNLGTHFGLDAKGRLYVDPAHLLTAGTPRLITDLIHGIYHWIHDHGRRGSGKVAVIWSLATECSVNGSLSTDGYTMMDDALTARTLGLRENLTAEEYYRILEEQIIQQAVSDAMSGDGEGTSDDEGSEGGESSPSGSAGATPTSEQLTAAANKILDNLKSEVPCPGGSGVTGKIEEWEDTDERVLQGLSEARQDAMRIIVANDIEDAIKSGGIGNMPAHLRRFAEKAKGPVVTPWYTLLRSSIHGVINMVAGMQDYTMRRPSRRNTDHNMYLPGIRGRRPKIAIAVDTSGSMGERELSVALREISGVLMTGNAEVQGFSVDVATTTPVPMRQLHDLELIGGGGTDMGNAIRSIEEQKQQYDMLVIITDCMTPWPAEKPAFKVVVVGVGPGTGRRGVPDWAEFIDAGK